MLQGKIPRRRPVGGEEQSNLLAVGGPACLICDIFLYMSCGLAVVWGSVGGEEEDGGTTHT